MSSGPPITERSNLMHLTVLKRRWSKRIAGCNFLCVDFNLLYRDLIYNDVCVSILSSFIYFSSKIGKLLVEISVRIAKFHDVESVLPVIIF